MGWPLLVQWRRMRCQLSDAACGWVYRISALATTSMQEKMISRFDGKPIARIVLDSLTLFDTSCKLSSRLPMPQELYYTNPADRFVSVGCLTKTTHLRNLEQSLLAICAFWAEAPLLPISHSNSMMDDVQAAHANSPLQNVKCHYWCLQQWVSNERKSAFIFVVLCTVTLWPNGLLATWKTKRTMQ